MSSSFPAERSIPLPCCCVPRMTNVRADWRGGQSGARDRGERVARWGSPAGTGARAPRGAGDGDSLIGSIMCGMKKRAIAAAILTFWLAAGYVFGSEPITFESGATQTTLLELFTSEGCSSCPAAEKWLSQFKTNSDLWKRIVPVAFHVDYWDNLGWPDRFAKAEFTDRQRRYAA